MLYDKLLNFISNTFYNFLIEYNNINSIKNKHFEDIYSIDHLKGEILKSGQFFDEIIIKYIIENMKYGKKIYIKIDNINIHFEFWDIKKNYKKIAFIFRYMCFLVYLFNKIKKGNTNIFIYLFNYNGVKLKPKDNIIKSINVNSGFSYNSQVVVYRKEEMIKVLTHELIHTFNIDNHYSELNTSEFNKIFCVKMPININETYTDSLACLINIIMYSILKKPKNLKHEFNTNFKKELNFMIEQSSKIININKYKIDKNNIICTIENLEETNGIAYYVLKSIIFNDFIKYLNNEGIILKDINRFGDFIISIINKNNWKKYINSSKMNNSLRMTILDIINLI